MTELSVEIFQLLGATQAVTDIIGHRFYTTRASQGTNTPYLVLDYISHEMPAYHLRGDGGLEKYHIRFHMFGKDRLELYGLRNAIMAMMANPGQIGSSPAVDFQSIYMFGTELPEDDIQMYHLYSDFSVWHDRS